MLGRTASNLFWISRFMERAENMARMLDVGYRVSLTPGLDSGHREQWESTLRAAGIAESFFEQFDTADVAKICDFMLFDRENPASVHSCLTSARNNARAVRTAITSEMWESINTTWLEFSAFNPTRDITSDIPRLVDWT
ncbi:MAG: alpha-E domain-containing protein, partial [Rhizobiaceae bacterium]